MGKSGTVPFYSIENAEIRYGWGFMPLKIAKKGKVGDFFH